jgi:hypothetical protein
VINSLLRRVPSPRTLRLALALCSVLAGGLLFSGAPAFAAGEAPTIASVSVSSITEHDATLEAQINPEGLQSTYQFQLGKECYPAVCALIVEIPLPVENLSSTQGEQSVSLDLNSVGVTLQPNSKYDYSVVATNSAGETHGYGDEKIFMTPSEGTTSGPMSETGSASNISQTSATLGGSVTPMAASVNPPRAAHETKYVFEYGTTTAYGASAPTPPGVVIPALRGCGIPCEVPSPEQVSETLTGLEPGATYHYRLVSTNLQGTRTSYGDDATFTTVPSTTNGASQSGASSAPTGSGGSSSTSAVPLFVSPLGEIAKPNALTRDQKLEKALKACDNDIRPKKQRAICRKRVDKKYAAAAKKADVKGKKS